MFEEEYKKIIERIKEKENYAVMSAICENVVNVLKENGVEVKGTVYRCGGVFSENGMIKENVQVCFENLDFTEHDKKYVDEINDLKKQLAEQTELAEHWYAEADKYEEILYIKAENSGYYDMTLRKFIELEKTAKEQKKQISELEEKLSAKQETEFPIMPIDVASMLINATVEYPTKSFQKAFGAGETSFADKYSKSDLREIAEHLIVFCNNDDEED